jgi:hypothetical protein
MEFRFSLAMAISLGKNPSALAREQTPNVHLVLPTSHYLQRKLNMQRPNGVQWHEVKFYENPLIESYGHDNTTQRVSA